MLTPQQIADKWLAGVRNGVGAYKQGVQAVRESPTAKAAARASQYVQGVQRAVDEQRFQQGLQAVSLPQWQAAASGKGADRLASGATQSLPTFVRFMTQFQPHLESFKGTLDQMPKGTVEDGINRAAAQIRHNASFRFNRAG